MEKQITCPRNHKPVTLLIGDGPRVTDIFGCPNYDESDLGCSAPVRDHQPESLVEWLFVAKDVYDHRHICNWRLDEHFRVDIVKALHKV